MKKQVAVTVVTARWTGCITGSRANGYCTLMAFINAFPASDLLHNSCRCHWSVHGEWLHHYDQCQWHIFGDCESFPVNASVRFSV